MKKWLLFTKKGDIDIFELSKLFYYFEARNGRSVHFTNIACNRSFNRFDINSCISGYIVLRVGHSEPN